jgi:hypothetical protein
LIEEDLPWPGTGAKFAGIPLDAGTGPYRLTLGGSRTVAWRLKLKLPKIKGVVRE